VLGVIWGAPIMLMFTWRRLTETAVRIQVVLCLLIIGVVPWIISATPVLRQTPALLVMTQAGQAIVSTKATESAVEHGLAKAQGETIRKKIHIEPVAAFFEDGVARVDPANENSPREGIGRFNIEIYLLSLIGIDVCRFSPAMLLATRYLVDAFLPLLLLLGLSLVTPPAEKRRLERFFVRLKTPVAATAEADAEEVEKSYREPDRFDHKKLFPKSSWEFTKWDRTDALGFLGCCAFVGVVLLVFKGVLLIGSR
jgi:hypothetical protein